MPLFTTKLAMPGKTTILMTKTPRWPSCRPIQYNNSKRHLKRTWGAQLTRHVRDVIEHPLGYAAVVLAMFCIMCKYRSWRIATFINKSVSNQSRVKHVGSECSSIFYHVCCCMCVVNRCGPCCISPLPFCLNTKNKTLNAVSKWAPFGSKRRSTRCPQMCQI